jgi:hypothetical protein
MLKTSEEDKDFLYRVSRVLGGRPVRWARWWTSTLEVFFADAVEQRELLHVFRPYRAEFEKVVNGPISIVFHSCSETQRLYQGPEGLISETVQCCN